MRLLHVLLLFASYQQLIYINISHRVIFIDSCLLMVVFLRPVCKIRHCLKLFPRQFVMMIYSPHQLVPTYCPRKVRICPPHHLLSVSQHPQQCLHHLCPLHSRFFNTLTWRWISMRMYFTTYLMWAVPQQVMLILNLVPKINHVGCVEWCKTKTS